MRAPNPCRRRRLVSLAFGLPLVTTFMVLALLRQDGGVRRTGSFQSEVIDASGDVVVTLRSSLLQKEYIDKRGIHVVIGYYQGNGIPWEATPNLTNDLINRNGYSPLPGAGEQGQPVYIHNTDHSLMKQLFHINRFNLMASDRIPLNRSLPDVRKKECKLIEYETSSLPSTSIIIVFHNEAWSTLLRTVHSVIGRSPRHLLHEIILVDDASDRKFLKQSLEDYVKTLAVPVKIVRLSTRSGLIRARIRGADVATGQVLTFLDAHCECTTGWLEPLLHSISKIRTRVACPVIDIINDDTFAYVRSFDLHWGAFNWELHFRWYAVSDSVIRHNKGDVTKSFRTPVMAGGLFAIDRDYFNEIGAYDPQMDIWGGENIEMSFRVWQCGGSIEIVPCSHVGHVFRKSSPYTFPRAGGVGAVLYSNLVRVAAVWMDEWINFYYLLNPEAKHIRSNVNVTQRIQLREKLQCKSFRWYLENVWPEHFLPTEQRFFGKIRNKKNKECLQKPQGRGGTNQATGNALTYVCHNDGAAQQYFVVSADGWVMTDESVCLDSPHVGTKEPAVVFLACNQLRRQRWSYQDGGSLMHLESGLCLDLPNQVPGVSLVLKTCTDVDSQTWTLEVVSWT